MRPAAGGLFAVLLAAGCAGVRTEVRARSAADFDTVTRAAPPADADPATSEYQRALTRIINDALRSGRLHPQNGLTVLTPAGEAVIPVRYVGVTWFPEEVGELHCAADVPVETVLKNHHTRPGWGVPLVGVSKSVGRRGEAERFTSTFPHGITLTAVLRPGPAPVLELIDRSHVSTVELNGTPRPLAADLSAPLALVGLRAKETGKREARAQFLKPNVDTGYDRLTGLEPYRPGTFPLVLIHGAKSDAFTWLNTLNEFRTDPDFTRRFQVLTFRYATGAAYPEVAADLREQGERFVAVSDPAGTDVPLRRWAMVGYSLGGPICRLTVSGSGSALWDAFSAVPFDRMTLTDRGRGRLRRIFFFEPMGCVKTAVLIGAPGDGGTLASNTLFRLAAWLIRYPQEDRRAYRTLLRNNPGAVRPLARFRIPTSLDLISRNNWLASAARNLPVPADVRLHSVVGNGWLDGSSDRVVPVASAADPRADTKTVIRMLHKDEQYHPASVARQLDILDEHAARFGMPR